MSRKWFRFLILLGWALCAASVTLFYFEKRSLPPELRNYLDAGADGPLNARDVALLLYLFAAVVVGVVTTVGLYRFRPWARPLCLWGGVAGYALSPFLFTEATVTPPLSGHLMSFNAMLGGFTMALLFFSPVARYFDAGPHKSEEVLRHGRPES